MNIHQLLRALLFLPVLAVSAWAELPPLPIVKDAEVALVDSGSGSGPHLIYYVFAHDDSTSSLEYYTVFFTLITTNSGHTLKAAANRVNFLPAELIGPGNQDYRDEGGSDRLDVSGFDESRLFEGVPWRYIDIGASAPATSFYKKARSLTEFYLGYRFAAADGSHFGWMKFTRSDTTFTTAFDLTASEWNPSPGASIGAGLSPVPLTTEVTVDHAGKPILQVSWNAAAASWIFETTPVLTPPVTWTPYPTGNALTAIPLDGGDAHRYFRLRRP